ncbi:MAG: PfkB family carbohydrate kinase [Candidatus Comchoanobacterales bacterium]
MIRILGDIMLDHWIEGDVLRVSPESPVPVLLEKNQNFALGGAGNLAANLCQLEPSIHLYGAWGNDAEGAHVDALCHQHGIITHQAEHQPTTTKHRLVNRCGQQLLRWDNEQQHHGSSAFHQLINDIKPHDFICISDYNKGIIQSGMCEQIAQKSPFIFVDPKQSFNTYTNAFLVKPNKKEFETLFDTVSIPHAQQAIQRFGWTWLAITLSGEGMLLVNQDQHWHIKQPAIEVMDVTGAGDVVLATLTHLISSGVSTPKAAEQAIMMARIAVQKKGTCLINKNLLKPNVVFTNGCFDILHPGHLSLLQFAKEQGHHLIVGLNSDSSIQRLKGSDRPYFSVERRKNMLESLSCVDEVMVFDEDTPLKLIESIQPDIIVKGGDYTPDQVIGQHLAKVVIFPTLEGFSTSNILKGTPCQTS